MIDMDEVPNLIEMAKGEVAKPEPKMDKSMTKYNAMKHGKFADLPALCDKCHYRAKEAGGTGKCDKYEAGAACVVRADIKKVCESYDTRDPASLKGITDIVIHMLFERVAFAEFIAKTDGNLLDKSTLAQVNTLHRFIQLQSQLGSTTISATQKVVQSGGKHSIREALKSISVTQNG